MNQQEFLPFHNYHISFKIYDRTEGSGVLIIPTEYNAAKRPTVHTYIPTSNLIEWKEAEKVKDIGKMNALQGEIDIETIASATRLS